jgi:peptidylprolyl isomerase
MAAAADGNTVKVHYTGKLTDGTVFDSSREREPMEFTLGEKRVLPAFENAVEGLSTGETTTTEIAAADAYGKRRDDLVLTVDKAQFPDDITPEVGQQLQVQQQDGSATQVVVTAVEGEDVTLDANHPLAGQDLHFEIELVEIC